MNKLEKEFKKLKKEFDEIEKELDRASILPDMTRRITI